DGNLLLVSRNSNIADGQPRPTMGADTANLAAGSFGPNDPFIGPAQLPEGTSRTYYVAVSSNEQLPAVLDATFQSAATDPLVRLEPVDSLKRVVDDRIGLAGTATAGTTAADTAQRIFHGSDTQLNTYGTPFTLGDVVLFVNTASSLSTVNPKTGAAVT